VTEITEGGIIVLYEDGGAQMYTESDFEELCGSIEQGARRSKKKPKPQQLSQHRKRTRMPTPLTSSFGSSSSSVGKPVRFRKTCWAWLVKQGWQCVHGDGISNYHYVMPAAADTPKHDRVHGFDFFRTLDEVWAYVAPRTSSMFDSENHGNGGSDNGDGDDDTEFSEEWSTSGHRWIGVKLARWFASGIATGRVTRWLPAGERDEDAALWGMEHDDGDTEELEEWEVVEAIEMLHEQQEEQHAQEENEQLGTRTNKRKQPTATTPAPAGGQLIEVMCEQDSAYYAGKCMGYDAASDKHTIEYEDGSTEVLRLQREGGQADGASAIWRLCAKKKRISVGRGQGAISLLDGDNCNDYDTQDDICSSTQDGHKHTSKYRGVSWCKRRRNWLAVIRHTGKTHYIGCFDDEEEAARAYDRAARKHRGDKATLNFPAEGEKGVLDSKRSKYRGVYWDKSNSKWKAQIHQAGKRHSLGSFDDEEEAARAYDRAAKVHYGDTATLNFKHHHEEERECKEEEEEAKKSGGRPSSRKEGSWLSSSQTSKYRGVYWNKRDSKWNAQICQAGKQHSLGCFNDEEEAARAYDRAARAHRGDKATLNFPAEGEQGVDNGQTSKYRGVTWNKNSSKWIARIKHTGKHHHLGYFHDEEDAARAYNRAARAHTDDKAVPNFPAEADDEQEQAQEQAAAGPVEVYSWSGMYPSVVVALGFRLQVRRSGVAGAEAEEKIPEGTRSRGRKGKQLDHGVVVEEAGENTTWACELILRKRHASGSKVEYEVSRYYRNSVYRKVHVFGVKLVV
jgi:hypothetical protein